MRATKRKREPQTLQRDAQKSTRVWRDFRGNLGLGLRALVLSLAGAVPLAACDLRSECRSGAYRCQGNAAHNCQLAYSDSGAPHVWSREDCEEGACRTDRAGAFCSLSPDPHPPCEGRRTICDGNTLVRCRDGYATDMHECGTDWDGEGAYCLTHREGAVCSLDPGLSNECNRDMFITSACRENHILTCEYGLATRQRSCEDGYCKNPSDVFCSLSKDRDPRCPEDRFASYCSSPSILVACRHGYPVEETLCPETLVCKARSESNASCAIP